MIISAIAAVAENGVIGKDGKLPWNLPDDMKFFQRTTLNHYVISGRKSYESIPPRFRPLPGRTNVVVTHDKHYDSPGAIICHSLKEAVELARKADVKEVFLIGGGQLYKEAFDAGLVDRFYRTTVHAKPDGDTFFPEIGEGWKEVWSEKHKADERHPYAFTFAVLQK
ncbi:MAG TPA: dihydrofolate reductase [Flavobacteriales bacterium]|nr:dihydrofolate reductase [Flavobacteriales bacterium]HRO40360.1 dihydrofolate reductase [Flavobacteriales bacterium]HRP82707.1 dihydrofolate reductase [Flavobacteriales bacterium]HRQ86453.1 dihydrofolate reductase [Flavobacteriales bacterium]